jgi:hypothetical protein
VGRRHVRRRAGAGGRVTYINGAPLDISHGRFLVANRGVIATDGHFHDEVVAAVRQVADQAVRCRAGRLPHWCRDHHSAMIAQHMR